MAFTYGQGATPPASPPGDGDDDDDEDGWLPEVAEVPITDELDLHTFHPSEVGALVPDYLAEAAKLGLREVRIVHGKGTGALRRTVEAALRRSPDVESFVLGGAATGGWGATRVVLKPRRG